MIFFLISLVVLIIFSFIAFKKSEKRESKMLAIFVLAFTSLFFVVLLVMKLVPNFDQAHESYGSFLAGLMILLTVLWPIVLIQNLFGLILTLRAYGPNKDLLGIYLIGLILNGINFFLWIDFFSKVPFAG